MNNTTSDCVGGVQRGGKKVCSRCLTAYGDVPYGFLNKVLFQWEVMPEPLVCKKCGVSISDSTVIDWSAPTTNKIIVGAYLALQSLYGSAMLCFVLLLVVAIAWNWLDDQGVPYAGLLWYSLPLTFVGLICLHIYGSIRK